LPLRSASDRWKGLRRRGVGVEVAAEGGDVRVGVGWGTSFLSLIETCFLPLPDPVPVSRDMVVDKRLIIAFVMCATAVGGQAQLGHEIAQRHAGRAGDKLAALQSLRAEGRTFISGEMVPFTLTAERPNRLKVESFSPLRRVIQGYDGEKAPWLSHSEVKGGVAQDMAAADAKDFVANADFDGPLVNFAEKGYSVDYAGEDVLEGRRAYKLLIMSPSDDIFFMWVDAENHEVVKRTVYKANKEGRVTVETFFKDFRPVAGVLQPHRVETTANGRLIYVMVIDAMKANEEIPKGTFGRP
jgi:outer membrane lipoprotein-sorting protein